MSPETAKVKLSNEPSSLVWKTPDADFGLPFQKLKFNFQEFNQREVRRVVRGRLEEEIEGAKAKLSEGALRLSELPEMRRLDNAFNTASAHTGLFNHVDVSRYEHSLHAAAQVHDLKLPLSKYEKTVLEIALLFHDIGHVPGSHAMDRVFATLPGAPRIGEWGYGKEDYHEVHGARLVCQGPSSNSIRKLCGDRLFGDVMAVLTHDDKRDLTTKQSYYGAFSPSLPDHKIARLYALKDVLDRTSYLILDHISAGYCEDVVQDTHEKVQRYLNSLLITDKEVCTKLSPQGGMEIKRSNDPYEDIIWARKNHFDEIPGHPSNGLVTLLLQRAVWGEIARWNLTAAEFDSPKTYEKIRDLLVSGQYADVLGEETCRWLFDREHCVADQMVPLATLRKEDLSDRGQQSLEKARKGRSDDESIPLGLTSSLMGAPLYDTTRLELLVNHHLQSKGISTPVHFIIAHQLDKDFEYQVANGESTETRAYRPTDPSKRSGHVVLTAKAIDESGMPVDLVSVQEAVETFLVKAELVSNDSVFRERYNPNVFVEPYTPEKFCDAVQKKFLSLSPGWIQDEAGQELLNRHKAWEELM